MTKSETDMSAGGLYSRKMDRLPELVRRLRAADQALKKAIDISAGVYFTAEQVEVAMAQVDKLRGALRDLEGLLPEEHGPTDGPAR